MKTAVIYASSHGTTEKVATQIANELPNTDIINLKKQSKIDLDMYTHIVIGGSIHAGKIQNEVKTFCQNNMIKLLEKHIGLFICAMNEPDYDTELKNAFPELLMNHAKTKKVVGGEFLLEKMNFIEKFLVKKIAGVTESQSKINNEKIHELIAEISQ